MFTEKCSNISNKSCIRSEGIDLFFRDIRVYEGHLESNEYSSI